MKRLILVIVLTALLAVSYAGTRSIFALRTHDLEQGTAPEKLYSSVRALAQEGCEVYYYNENYVLLGKLSPRLSYGDRSRLIPLEYDESERLYLVSRIPAMHEKNLSQLNVLLDLDSSLLVSSGMDAVKLATFIANPFTEIGTSPMRFSAINTISDSYRETRTTIEQLVAQVNADSVQYFIQSLQNFQTRYALADNRLTVATWIRDQYIRMGLTNARIIPFQWNNTTQYNVEATLTGNVAPNEYVLVGGHHDSILSTGDATVFAPGADDNASGAVASLEMARVMTTLGYTPKCSIRFLTFAAEEFGLWGAKDYATRAEAQNMQIRVMMNHDMIAYSTQSPADWQVRLMPYDGSLDQSSFAANLTEQYTTLNPVYGSFNSGSSDSHPFWQHGFKVIYFFEHTFSPYYHSIQDIVANLNPAYCAEVIKASVACAVGFANMPVAPVDLTVHDVGNGSQLQVNWNAPPETQVAHYNLYVGPSPGEMGEPIQLTGTSYTLNGLTEGFLYCIQVSTVDAGGNESYRPMVTCTPRSVPLVPAGFAETPQANAIRISWNANQELDLAGYTLYRSMAEDETGTALTGQNFLGTSYTDTAVNGDSGYYYYRLLAYDEDGNVSPFTQVISSRPITRDQGILIVDETKNLAGGSPFQPSDIQADSYYSTIMSHFRTTQFDTESHADFLRLADLGAYSSVLWHGNDNSEMSYPYYVRDALNAYLQAGGNILFSVYLPSQAFEQNASYPASFPGTSYINSVLGIDGADHSIAARFRYAISMQEGFPGLVVDSLKSTSALNYHLIRVEGLSLAEGATPLYSYGSDYQIDTPQGAMNGMYVGVMRTGSNGQKAITLSFPLYNMEEIGSRALVDHVFGTLFNEPVTNDDPENNSAVDIFLHNAYPNPSTTLTSFILESKEPGKNVSLKVYNIKGQLIRTIYDGALSQKTSVYQWDGLDSSGKRVGSGVYFLRASSEKGTAVRKILRLN